MAPNLRVVKKYVVLGLCFLASYWITGRLWSLHDGPVDRLFLAMDAEIDRQGIRQEFNARMKGVKTDSAGRAIGFALAREGVARLPVDVLAKRAQLLLYLDVRAEKSLCARRVLGTMTASQFPQYIGTFDSTELATWVTISVSAAKAEMLATAPRERATPVDIRRMVQTVESALSPTDRGRFADVLKALSAAPVHDQCWFGRTLVQTALALPEPSRSSALRTLAEIEAGP